MPSKFIICTPSYDDTSGGAIVLHKLQHVLVQQGHQAWLWPIHRLPPRPRLLTRQWVRRMAYHVSRLWRPGFATHPRYQGLVAREEDLEGAVVVYPEIVGSNPLRADRYVRWLLHEPGYHLKTSTFSEGDLYFSYQEAFNRNTAGMVDGGRLFVPDFMRDIYRQVNSGKRSGVCYMLRKGKDRADLPSLDGRLVVDGLGHAALARVFNESRYCYFFDPYTAFAQYAAACGCIPIVVPLPGIAKDAWMPDPEGRLGIAYGDDDIEHAVATRDLLLARMAEAERIGFESVERFVAVVERHFWGARG